MDADDLSNISGYHYNSDDLFEELIEIDDGCTESERSDDGDKKGDKESDKENLNRSAKAKKLQFKLINEFLKEYDGASIETKKFNKLWEELACELNSLGPPTFTVSQWRFKWSQHKYNKKRKLAISAAEIAETTHREKQSHDVASSEALEENVSTSPETTNSMTEISDKLTVIIQKEDAILKALQRGNTILEEISQSLNKRHF